jgi:hypothetical protein
MVGELQKILQLQAESIADYPHKIPFIINNSSMLPEGFPVVEKDGVTTTELVVYPAKVGTFIRIYPLLSKIDPQDIEKITVTQERAFDPSAPEVMGRYAETIVEIICVALHNKKGDYPPYMPEFIRENCSFRDLHVIVNSILARLGTMAFIDSTTELMKVGPGAEEMIALQKNLQSWRKPN